MPSDPKLPAITSDEFVYRGYVSLRRVRLRMPDGQNLERHIEDHGTSITVLPYDRERRTAVLVSMPRAPVLSAGEENLLEAIAGRVDDEPVEECARREALEEAGLRLNELRPVGAHWTMPSLSLERISFFLAPYRLSDKVALGGGAIGESECIHVHELPLAAIRRALESGEIRDLKTAYLIQALMIAEPELFHPDFAFSSVNGASGVEPANA